jgi:hypothetical protein
MAEWLELHGAAAVTWQLAVGVVGLIAAASMEWAEDLDLRRYRARLRARMLNALRLGAAYGCLVVGLAVAHRSGSPSPVFVPFGLMVLGLTLLPTSWVLRLGGVERVWEIHRTYLAASRLKGRGPTPPQPEIQAAQRKHLEDLKRLKTPDTAEWIDLMVADINDWIRSRYRFVEVGRRQVRLHEIDRALLGADAPAAERSPEEATFLWRLYKAFARIYDIGDAPQSPDVDAKLRSLAAQLEPFRRPDTDTFIDGVQAAVRTRTTSSRERSSVRLVRPGNPGDSRRRN